MGGRQRCVARAFESAWVKVRAAVGEPPDPRSRQSRPEPYPHLHAVFLDGVHVPGADAVPEFRALPRLSTTDVADALQVARARE